MQIVLENIEKQICFIYICKCAWVTPYEENSLVGFLMYSHWIRREAESFHGSIFVGFVLDLLLDLSLSQFLTHTNTQTKVNKTYRNEFLFFFLQIFFRNLNATVHSDTRIYLNLQKCSNRINLFDFSFDLNYKEFKKCFQKCFVILRVVFVFFAQFSYVLFLLHFSHLTFSHLPCIYFPVLLMHHNLKSKCRASS